MFQSHFVFLLTNSWPCSLIGREVGGRRKEEQDKTDGPDSLPSFSSRAARDKTPHPDTLVNPFLPSLRRTHRTQESLGGRPLQSRKWAKRSCGGGGEHRGDGGRQGLVWLDRALHFPGHGTMLKTGLAVLSESCAFSRLARLDL